MPYRKQNYWPVIYTAAGLSGLVAVILIFFLIKILLDFDNIGEDQVLLFLLLGLGVLLSTLGCLGTIMKKWWGRGVLTFVAALYLLAFPVGTILGFFVLKGLATHKNEFR